MALQQTPTEVTRGQRKHRCVPPTQLDNPCSATDMFGAGPDDDPMHVIASSLRSRRHKRTALCTREGVCRFVAATERCNTAAHLGFRVRHPNGRRLTVALVTQQSVLSRFVPCAPSAGGLVLPAGRHHAGDEPILPELLQSVSRPRADPPRPPTAVSRVTAAPKRHSSDRHIAAPGPLPAAKRQARNNIDAQLARRPCAEAGGAPRAAAGASALQWPPPVWRHAPSTLLWCEQLVGLSLATACTPLPLRTPRAVVYHVSQGASVQQQAAAAVMSGVASCTRSLLIASVTSSHCACNLPRCHRGVVP